MYELKSVEFKTHKKTILKDISLQTPESGIVVIIGENGAGKSTLLRLLAGLTLPTSGEIRLGERTLDTIDVKQKAREISWLGPYTDLPFDFSVEEAVSLGLENSMYERGSPQFVKKKVREQLEKLNSLDLVDRSILELSSGEQKKVLLAQAMVSEPRILILDEPLNFLDYGASLLLLKVFKEDENMLVIMSTHNLNLLDDGMSIIGLKQGRLVGSGDSRTMLEERKLVELFSDLP